MPITTRVRPQPATDAVGGPPARDRSFWGAEVRRIRREQRMSQRRLARLAGVDRSCLLRFETGESRGNIDLIERLLAVLGYELDMMWRGFVGADGEPHAAPEPDADREPAGGEPGADPARAALAADGRAALAADGSAAPARPR